jgi:prevent-host-death family protein
MTNATATEVKNRFGEFMDKAQREPVTVEKTGRSYAVLIGFDEYQRLIALEDAYWAAKAVKAEASGYVGTDEAMRLLESR